MSRHTYLAGPTVCGLWGMFEENFGDSETPTPYVRITPSTIAGVILPFRCPRCSAVLNQFSDSSTRDHYHDTREDVARTSNGKKFAYQRDNYWCPSCGLRFNLRLGGMPLTDNAKVIDNAAPSLVEHFADSEDSKLITRAVLQDDGKSPSPTSIVGRLTNHYVTGTDILGCC